MIEPGESSKESTTPRPRPTSLNAAMTKDLYKNIPAPKPRRTHSTGLSGIVGLITEHLKRSPPPCLRQPSPQTAPFTGIMHPAKHAAFINSESNRSSSASIAEDQRGDSFNPSGLNLANNSTHSTEGPQSMLAEFCAAPFLGDRKSESGDLNLLFASAVGHRRGGKRIGEYNFTISSSFRRSLSLQGLSSRAALVPCMIPMPAGRPYHDLSDALESIPKHSWILPYVIACTPPEILGQLLDLQFLIEGQSHTHTTATTITRSRAHTISFDIDPNEPENTTFSVPLNMKDRTLGGGENDPFQNHHDPAEAPEKTDRLSFEDWNDFSSPYAMPLRESPPQQQLVVDRTSAESPVDGLPVTRARGHTHTGSAYEPDPSLFLPYPPPSTTASSVATTRSSMSRAHAHEAADFANLVRMSSASPRLGGGSHSSSFSNARGGTPSAAGSGKHSNNTDTGGAITANVKSSVTPPPPLTALQNTTAQNNTTDSNADAYSSRIQLLAPAPVKIPTVVGGLVPPSRTPSPTVSAAALGLAAQKVNFPSSWRSLGIVWLSADPKWNVWHPKIVFLLDNYLLECTAVGTGVIGFTQLSGAIVEKKVFHYNARKQVSPLDRRTTADTSTNEDDYFNTVAIEEGFGGADASPRPAHATGAEDNNNNTRAGAGLHGSRLASYGLKITCFTTSAPQSTSQSGRDAHSARHATQGNTSNRTKNSDSGSPGTHSYWLTTHDEASLDLIAAALQRASTLTFEDVFDVQRLTGEDSLLGQGRFNEVRLARRREDLDLLRNTSVFPSLFTSPQTKSRSTSNAPEYLPVPVEGHGTVHFDTSKVSDPWRLNKSISAASSRDNSRHRSGHGNAYAAPPFQPAHVQVAAHARAHAAELHASSKQDHGPSKTEESSPENGAEGSFYSVSSANSTEDFAPVLKVTNTEGALRTTDSTPSSGPRTGHDNGQGGTADSSLHGSEWHTQEGLLSPQTDDSSISGYGYDPHLAGSLSSQGPLFAMLQRENEPVSDPWCTTAAKKVQDAPVDPFAVRNPHSVASSAHSTYDEFGAYSAHGARAIADNDRMSDDVIPASPLRPVAATSDGPPLSYSMHSYGSNSLYISKDPSTHLSDSCHDLLSVSNHGGLFNDDSRFQGEELYKCCAMKLVAKEIFWTRVDEGCERGDALVREVLAQMLVATHFADHPGLTFSSVLQVPPYLNSQDSVSGREPVPSAGIALSPVQSMRSFGSPEPVSAHGFATHAQTPASAPAPTQGHLPLVQLFSAFETADGFAMELELMQSMDLFDLLAEVGALPEHHVQGIVAQLVEAVSLCNKLGIAHRDIKLSNVCFSLNQCRGASIQSLLAGRECIRVKLADFGMTGFLARDKRLRGRCGTPGYVAPDILNADKNGTYGLNVDMFSIGVVAYTLLCGYEPFYGSDNKELLRANKAADYKFHSPDWDAISADAKDWISRALQCDAHKRPTPDAARKHAWLKHLFVKSGGGGGGERSGGSGGRSGNSSNFSSNTTRHNSDTDPFVVNNSVNNHVYSDVYNTDAGGDNTHTKSCTIS